MSMRAAMLSVWMTLCFMSACGDSSDAAADLSEAADENSGVSSDAAQASALSTSCPDKIVSCDYDALGYQGTCWSWSSFSCKSCGSSSCNFEYTDWTTVPKQTSIASCVNVLDFKNDGCSVPLTDKVTDTFKKVLFAACEEHDICFSVYGTSKNTCDSNFYSNMTSICTDYYSGILNTFQKEGCLAAAVTWYSAVTVAGDSAFIRDQQLGKDNCVAQSSAPGPLDNWLSRLLDWLRNGNTGL